MEGSREASGYFPGRAAPEAEGQEENVRRPLIVTAIVVAAAFAAPAAAELPKSLEELQARIASEARTPRGAAKLWFDAVFVYTHVDKELGAQMITEMSYDKHWQKTQRYLPKTLEESPYVFRSYAAGATPENDYAMDPQSYELTVVRENAKPYGDKPANDYVKIFVSSSGASTPRPMTLRRNARGEYKAYEVGAIYTMVREPASEKAKKENF